jgi:hypothetical protein
MRSPLHPDQSLSGLPRNWMGRSGFVLLFLLGWFGLQFPLVPTTVLGFAVNVAFALFVLGYGIFIWRSIVWLRNTALARNVKGSLELILAASVGVAIFVTAYLSRDFLSTNFGFRHLFR